jgi:hypothetical protein
VPLSSFYWFSLKTDFTAFIRNVGNQSSNYTVSYRRRLGGPSGSWLKVKVKVKVKVKFPAEQATKSQRGSRGIALLFL